MNSLKDITKLRLSETFHGDTQEVIAKKLNTTQGNVSKWVNGQQIPTPEMLHDISKIYKVSVDWLLGISDEREIDGIALEKLTYEQVARIITDALRQSRTVDWERKESARAGMRRMVKRLLRKYKYPPEGLEDAIQTVISQCEMWTDNGTDNGNQYS